MEKFNINVKERLKKGSGGVGKLKREGITPGVLYQGAENLLVMMSENELRNIIDKKGKDVILNISFNGKEIPTVIKEVQRDYFNGDIRHIDLMPLNETDNMIS